MTESAGQRFQSAFTFLTGLANNSVCKLTVDKNIQYFLFFSPKNKELHLLLVLGFYVISLEIIISLEGFPGFFFNTVQVLSHLILQRSTLRKCGFVFFNYIQYF